MLAAALLPGAALAQRATLERIVRHDTLPNGLTVVVVENHNVPLATAEIVFRGGAMTQTPDIQGVPHLFEHMLFKTYRGRNGRTFDSDANAIKAGYNGATDDESVSYFLSVPADHADDAIGLLAALVRDPHFDEDNLRTERFVVRGEMQRRQSDPRSIMSDEVARQLWGTWFPRKNTIGDDLSLFAVSAKRLEDVFGAYYVPNNAALVVTGDVDPARISAAAKSGFGGWKRRPDPFVTNPVPAPPPLDSTRAVVLTAEVGTVTVELAWRGPSVRRDIAATYDADALAGLLNDADSPFQRKVVDAGKFQSARFAYNSRDHGGTITFDGVTTPENTVAALTALEAQLSQLADSEYFQPSALRAAKKRQQVSAALLFEESTSLAGSLGFWWSVAGLDYFIGYFDALGARSRSDVSAFARTYLLDKPYVAGVLTSEKAAPGVARILGQFNEMMRK